MAIPVYSAPLIYYKTGTPYPQYTVPAGMTAVIKQCSFVQNVGNWEVRVAIGAPGSTNYLTLWHDAATSISGLLYTSVHAEGTWVVPDGYTIFVTATTIGTDASGYVGGYLLTGVIPQEQRALLDAQFIFSEPLEKGNNVHGEEEGHGLKQGLLPWPSKRSQRQAKGL